MVDEPLELLDLLLLRADEAVARGEQQLAALEPLGRVRDLGDVHPAHRVAGGLGAGEQLEVEIGDLEDVLDGDHRWRFYIMSKYSGSKDAQPQAASTPLCTEWRGERPSRAGPRWPDATCAGAAPARELARVDAVGDHRHPVHDDPVETLRVARAGCSRTGSCAGSRLVARSRTRSRSKTTRSAARPGRSTPRSCRPKRCAGNEVILRTASSRLSTARRARSARGSPGTRRSCTASTRPGRRASPPAA